MAEPKVKKESAPETGGQMLRDLKAHHNMFWTSVQDFHLEPLLNRAYQDPKKSGLIRAWLGKAPRKTVLIRQPDFYCDPLLIEFTAEGWTATVLEGEPAPPVEVELSAMHLGLISLSESVSEFMFGMLRGNFKLPLLFKNLRDHYYAMRIFLGG